MGPAIEDIPDIYRYLLRRSNFDPGRALAVQLVFSDYRQWRDSMNNSTIRSILVVGILTVLTGCTANQHIAAVQDTDTDRMTVGSVQKEITVGMPASRVAEIIGSPNIVTSDEHRRETWIYDKISTEVAYSNSSGGIAGLLIGGSGGGLAAGSLRSGATSTTQRTLTVIIHFDDTNRVRDFAYHTSRF
jgi:outer membrane protein assembly factor BamE (lipoprotein component of BamABCDE complex)